MQIPKVAIGTSPRYTEQSTGNLTTINNIYSAHSSHECYN